ncbi:MAG: response regulator, partial [Phycisphaerae bacterium]|nr:response regulator [Phycisphaerae bacterium]
ADYANPDLILLDVLMPGMDGFTVCQRLKEQTSTRSIPVIFMTALTDT